MIRRALMAMVLLVGFAGVAAPPGTPPEEPVEDLLLDLPAKDFQARDLRGDPVALEDYRGKVLVLNFWGTWCAPCRVEIPELVQLHGELRSQGLEILGVNAGDDPRVIPAFAEKLDIRYRVVLDEGITDAYGIHTFPTNVVVDRQGRVRYVGQGYHEMTVPTLRRVVEHLLAGP